MSKRILNYIVDAVVTFALMIIASCSSFDNTPEYVAHTAEYYWYNVTFDPDNTGDKVIVLDAHVYNEEEEIMLEEPDSSKSAYEMLDFLKYHKLPNRIDVAWYSYLEDKVYRVETEVPYESILKTARYITDSERLSLNLSVRLLPKGKVNIESNNFGSCVREEWEAFGVETHEYDDSLPKEKEPVFEGYSADIERNNYNIVRDSMKADSLFLVDVCDFRLVRYDYDIEFDIKDYWLETISLSFQNGEQVSVGSKNILNTLIKNPSVPLAGNIIVSDRKDQYCIYINFDQMECWSILEYAKDENVGEKGVMTITYEDDKVNAVLRYGSKVYPFRNVLSNFFSMSELRSDMQNMIE